MAAKRALLAWELGAGYGHLANLRAIARLLRNAGHACAFAVRQLGPTTEFLEPELGLVVQAPARINPGPNPVRTQVSYASLLHNIAFDDPTELAGRIRAWRDLLRALRTDIVFADHAPIALIAAKSLGLPCHAVGNGFVLPPLVAPFPSFRPRMRITDEVLRHNEKEVLAELNIALEKLKLAPFAALQDIFRDVRPGLLTYPELDHYEVPRPEPYLGMPLVAHGEPPDWPAGKGPKIFAYLRPSQTLVPAMEALAASGARVLVRIAEAPPQALAEFVRPGLAITGSSVDLKAAAESCDAFVSYAPHGTVCEFLLAGKPGVLLPAQHEQMLLTRRVVALGAGIGVQGSSGVGKALIQLLEDPKLAQAASSFSRLHAGQLRGQILPTLVDLALASLNKA